MSDIRFCTLFSGSSANCTFIEAGSRAILIDAGAGVRKTEQALAGISRTYSDIEGIFITHEHTDHIAGLSTIIKYNNRIPILSNEATLNAVVKALPTVKNANLNVFPTSMTAKSNNFSVTSFKSSHDSAESVGYFVTAGKKKLGFLTDTGTVSEEMTEALKGSNAVVIESNHDVNMLRNGPYPYILKKRIEGRLGHLSNNDCLRLLKILYESGTRTAVLAHLSNENNTPSTALSTVVNGLKESGITDMEVIVAPRQEASRMIEL